MSFSLPRSCSALCLALCAALLTASILTTSAHAAVNDSLITHPQVSFRIDPASPCDKDSIRVIASVDDSTQCWRIFAFEPAAGGGLQLALGQIDPAACSTLPEPSHEERSYSLGRQIAGSYRLTIRIATLAVGDTIPTVREQVLEYAVRHCATDELPFVGEVVIGNLPPPCATCPPVVCPNVLVPVSVRGMLPNSCWQLVGIGLSPRPQVIPIDYMPTVVVIVREPRPDSSNCTGGPVPFSADLQLPPQSPGLHPLAVSVIQLSGLDSTIFQRFTRTYEFMAVDTCGGPPPPPHACVFPFLEPRHRTTSDSSSVSPCDLRLIPGGHGDIVFAARAVAAPLAGLQGVIEPGLPLHLDNIEAIGAAAGMHLQWTRKGNGATFVLFADHGAPIPVGELASVLRVTVSTPATPLGPTTANVVAAINAGSDSLGNSLILCPVDAGVLVAAHVCIGVPSSCDANGDGVSNVADLVRMVHCLLNPATCPDTIAGRPDCNGDGAFHLDDIFCCARGILGGPRDSSGAVQGHMSFAFGAPRMDGALLHVPLTVHGADQMGGALLRIDYPSDRWIAVNENTATMSGVASWAPLVELGTDDLMVGLLRLDSSAPADLSVNLAFSLRPGAAPGGDLHVGASDISTPDGSPVTLDLSGMSTSLAVAGGSVPARVSLSPARPNPSTGSTSFEIGLPVAGDVDLAVFDLAGRRAATLWHGTMAAGTRTLTWNAGNASSGVYFARLVVNGEVRSTRVTLRLGH